MLYGVFLLGAVAWKSLQLFRQAKHPHTFLMQFLYGSGPNLIAGVCLPAFFLLFFPHVRLRYSEITILKWFLLSVAFSQIGLIGWEIAQLFVGGAVYDPFDIAASLLGAFLSLPLYFIVKNQNPAV